LKSLLAILFFCVSFSESYAQKYVLLQSYKIQDSVVKTLDEPLRALAAWYSAAGGTGCGFQSDSEDTTNRIKKRHRKIKEPVTSDSENCGLTTALGLDAQGSEAHKALLKKYFYDDGAAQQFIKQDCYVRPDLGYGNPPVTRFEDLSFLSKGDIVTVKYKFHFFEQYWDEDTITKGPDIWKISKDHIVALKRNIWKSYLKKKKKT
jgi:hypothetical protein